MTSLLSELSATAGAAFAAEGMDHAFGQAFVSDRPDAQFQVNGALAADYPAVILALDADVCITGGEDFPGLAWHRDPVRLASRNPRLVVVSITGYPEAPAVPHPHASG